MITLVSLVAVAVAAFALLAWRTRRDALALERALPPAGRMINVRDEGKPRRMHVLDLPGNPELLPVVFLHGASGNLSDQAEAFARTVADLPDERRFRSIYLDRPGSGYSQRRAGDDRPLAQAGAVAATLDALSIERAVICGHSFGAGIAVTLAVACPDRVSGLVLLAPAAYPWPGDLKWPYRMAALPVIRTLAVWSLVMPLGRRLVPAGIDATFAPDPPPEGYRMDAATDLLLRPGNFLANAADVLAIKREASKLTPSYASITAPTWILQGMADHVVRPTIHAVGLARAIAGARLETIEGMGHKPDYMCTERIVRELAAMAGSATASNRAPASAGRAEDA